MGFDNIGARIEVKLPDIFQQHAAGDHASGVAQHIFQKLEFLRLQLHGLSGAAHFAADQVHLQIAHAQRGLACFAPPGDGVHPRHQFGQCEGFGEVIVAAAFQARHAIVDAAHGSEEEDRRLAAFATQFLHQAEAVHAGKHPVHDQGCMLAGPRHGQAFGTGEAFFHIMAVRAQGMTDMVRRLGIVFNHQYLHVSCPARSAAMFEARLVAGKSAKWPLQRVKLIFRIGNVTHLNIKA